jgi:hypothetical protein
MVRRETAREFRHRLPHSGKIQVLLVGPLPDLGDPGVVDLDFVMDLVDRESRAGRQRKRHEKCGEKLSNGAMSRLNYCYARM